MTRRGQTTIPMELRHKYGVTEGTRLVVLDTEQGIVFRKEQSTLDLAGSGKASVERVFELLDRMREEDDK
ncbi:MAG: AbrB/MazE/SpoVT family DNA-binding domain-containing protein [Candidatus Bathyarchaeia archaeon]